MKTLNEIKPVKEAREDALLKLPGVTGVGIGPKIVGGNTTDELSIRVYVAEKKDFEAIPEAERIPKTIKGVKTDVIQRKFVLHQRMMAVADMILHKDTGTYDPLRGGMSIGPCRSVYLTAEEAACHGAPRADYYNFVGTLGCIVLDNDTNAEMLLSNFHVMCVDDGWSVGDTMCQPSRVDGGTCPADVVGSLQRAVLSDEVDAAIASHTARGHQCSILDIGDVTGTATATVGMAVRKRGRTTGLTYGTVTDTNLSVRINYCDGLGVRTLIHQIEIEVDPAQSAIFATGGDSGSVVVNSAGKVVGLYFAGDEPGTIGVANPIASVLQALNVRMCVTKPWDIVKKLEPDIKKGEVKEKPEPDIIKKLEKDQKEPDIKKGEVEPIKGYEPPITKGYEPPITKGYEPPITKGYEPPITTGPGVTPPVTPGVTPFIGQQAATQPVGTLVEERLARLEAAMAQLTHFIQSATRPNLDRSPLQNESDVGRSE